MRSQRISAIAALLGGMLAAAQAEARIVPMATVIDGAQSVPGSGSTATGFATISVDTDANTLTYHVEFSGLSSPEIAAHIHGPALRGEVAFAFLHFLPAGSPKDGVWNYPENLENDILDGQTYINIHSVQFNNGEIRGQIERAVPAGERAGWMALAGALLVSGAVARRRAAWTP